MQTASFTAFNSQIAALRASGVRITAPGATVAQDVEPESIAFSADGTQAYVTLQENNALAIVNIATATVTAVQPLGVKNHNLPGNGIDPSDRDGSINIRNVPVVGLYQPDAIASFTINGQTYLITANEGDSRDYTGFSEEVRVGAASYVLDPTTFPDAATLKQPANLGRLQVTSATGDTDGDGDFDRIEAFGSRSFSIWDSSGNQIFDSGDQLERITAARVPDLFNSDGSVASPSFDSRSDNKGPEPEGVVVGVVGDRTYGFIGLERTGDVIVYDLTNPASPQFVEYINTPEDVGPEGLTFISATDSPTGKPLLVTANEVSRTIAVFEFTPPVQISDIQGTQHISPLNGQGVQNVEGVVTAIAANGFYIQDPTPDANAATSEGIFVFTGTSAAGLAIRNARTVGEAVLVSGTVSEFRPGNNNPNNLTITQIGNNSSVQALSVSAWTNAPTVAIAPTILGNGGRIPPSQIINNDAVGGNVENPATPFDPAEDGIDFYESLEGMVVQINDAVATSPTGNFGTSEEIWVLGDNGANATSRTERGGSLITATDFNPERIQIDDLINGAIALPDVNVGARFGTITGVVSYDFNNYEVLVPTAPTVVQPSPLQREVTDLTGTATQLTVATFNVENLAPSDGAAKFNAIAGAIVSNLRSPDILSLEEIQDNNGAINDSVVDASLTFQTLIDAIVAAGGPRYEFRQLNPVDDQDGGQPGGNIRVGFLFNPDRVGFVEGSLQRLTDPNPAEADSFAGDDFASSRKPLVGQFVFNNQTVTVIGNHFNSKGGDQPLFGPNQPPTLTSELQRNQQATIVRNFVQGILATDPNANVIVGGDLNDFEFSNPLTILENGGLNTLVETLPENERYTYNFQGNAQVLDHILVSNNLLAKLDRFDVVHINSEFADQVSDHDPTIARFNLPIPNTAPIAQPDSASTTDLQPVTIAVLANDRDPDAGDTIAIQSFTNPTNGTLVQNADNTFTYTPAIGFAGADSFTYVLQDAAGLTSTATVSLTVTLGSNSIIGTNDNDNLVGTNRIDVIQGLAGNDTLNGGLGADVLSGGLGNDTYIVDNVGDRVVENPVKERTRCDRQFPSRWSPTWKTSSSPETPRSTASATS
ncbi:MAG: cadherin-like domain-containing protein [Leptolyngbyaceae cyanobacterium SM1_3_5]|nr:cadherin-like domain-containing protein [Leptolyngbyaceae cyanobacterium SM1_3_5]